MKEFKEIKDIRINKKNFKNNIMELSFFKINFIFFSNILKKYKGNKYVESLISQQVPLVFLIKSDNNESILKSVSDILELLKQKNKFKKINKIFEKTPDSSSDETDENINKFYQDNIQNKIINNEYHPADLTYNYEKKDERILQVLESIILNIKKNLKLNKKSSDLLQKQELGSEKKQEFKPKQELSKKSKIIKKISKLADNKTKIKIKKENAQEKQKSDNLEENKIKKEELEENQQVLKTISLKKITSKLEKINEKIIKRNIQKAKINKINYDFISKNRILSRNIYNKVNDTIFSIINKNNKVKHFSEVSKNIFLLNKKFKTNNIIKELQDIIYKNKIKQKNTKYNISKSRFSQKSLVKNNLTYQKDFKNKKLLNSLVSFYFDVSKNYLNSVNFKNKITKNKILDKYEKINLIKKFNYILDKNKKIKDYNIFDSNSEFIDNFIFKNNLTYQKDFKQKKLLNSLVSFYSDISKNYSSSVNLKNKITKNKILDKYKKINLVKRINYILDKNKKIKNYNIFDSNSEFIDNFIFKNNLTYQKDFKNKKLFNSLVSFYSDISKNYLNSVNFKNKITKNLEKISGIKQNKYFTNKNEILSDNFIHKINKSKILSNKFKTHSNYSEFNLNSKNLIETEKNIKKYENLFSGTSIIYRKKTNIEKLVKDIIDKNYKDKNRQDKKENLNKEYYNNKNLEILKNIQKKSQEKKQPEITKDEVGKIIKSYIDSINFKKISDSAVLEVENKMNLERYRNGIT